MPIDGEVLARGLGAEAPPVPFHHLCRTQLSAYREALAGTGAEAGAGEGDIVVACAQEAPLFAEVAETAGAAVPRFVDIRDRAGWSDEAATAGAKMAALIAQALQAVAPTPAVTLTSQGRILVVGRDEAALDAAARLAGERAVTCLLIDPSPHTLPPFRRTFAVFSGRLLGVQGHLGAFSVKLGQAATLSASARSHLVFDAAVAERAFEADIIVDLTGGMPILAPRDGYLRADPGNIGAVAEATGQALGLLGTFEKPRYIRFEAGLCAHARNRRTACTRCIDACPSAAITPDGDHVRVDAAVCAGHGACVSACPTGAMNFDYPAGNGVLQQLDTLLRSYRKAGGDKPVLLIYQGDSGDALLSALARFGGGLPARVLPLAMAAVAACGVDFLLTAVARGVDGVVILADPAHRTARGDDLAPLLAAAELVNTVIAALGWDVRVEVVVTADPDALAAAVTLPPLPMAVPAAVYLPIGDRRSLIDQALGHLARHAPHPVDVVPLAPGAPFGAVVLDADRCTLCLSCIGVCPTGALTGHPDKPSLGFQESRCVQCGLCRVTCPEKVISLVPQLSLCDTARSRAVLKEEEPHHCSRCGKPFGSRSSVAMLLDKLAGHPMFAATGRLALIEMCEDCRVVAQYEMEEGQRPFQLGPPRMPRTTEDYLREREEARRMAEAAERAFRDDRTSDNKT